MRSKILDGVTLEEALGCLWKDGNGNGGLFLNGRMYASLMAVGIPANTPVEKWEQRIRAYYADRDKAKWKEPVTDLTMKSPYLDSTVLENLYEGDADAEIKRTNDRRWLEEFARLNGGAGRWFIGRRINEENIWTAFQTDIDRAGQITFATREAARYIIENHSDKLDAMRGEGRG